MKIIDEAHKYEERAARGATLARLVSKQMREAGWQMADAKAAIVEGFQVARVGVGEKAMVTFCQPNGYTSRRIQRAQLAEKSARVWLEAAGFQLNKCGFITSYRKP